MKRSWLCANIVTGDSKIDEAWSVCDLSSTRFAAEFRVDFR